MVAPWWSALVTGQQGGAPERLGQSWTFGVAGACGLNTVHQQWGAWLLLLALRD